MTDITAAGPNDWLTAAADHRRRHPRDAVTANRPVQVHRALAFLWNRAHDGGDTIPARAAAIVSALPGAPDGEAILGVRDSDVTAPELPAAARELLEHLGADVPAPVIEPTAVIAQPSKAKAKGKAQAAADDPETAEAVAGLAERADAIIASLTTGQDGAA